MSDHPYENPRPRTQLGSALAMRRSGFLRSVDVGGLDVIELRKARHPDLAPLAGDLAAMLAAPRDDESYREAFEKTYNQAMALACPLWTAVVRESQKLAGISSDYNLRMFDPETVFMIEDEAHSDTVIADFLKDILARLNKPGEWTDQTAWRQAVEILSEAIVYRLLRDKGAGRIKVERMPEGDSSTPDFRCTLLTREEPLAFYVEVKTLDIVQGDQRHAEMLDEGMLVQDRLDKQIAAGARVAIAEGEIAPYRKFKSDPDYDWRSVRMSIERLIDKGRQAFKSKQFALGPTFALASLMRMPIHDHGVRPLVPFAFDPHNGGSCVSGVLWNICFGEVGDPIHRWPEFEGAGTADGRLAKEGLLVGEDRLPGPGVIFLRKDRDGVSLDGIVDSNWEKDGWSNVDTEEVMSIFCRAFNDEKNTCAHTLSKPD